MRKSTHIQYTLPAISPKTSHLPGWRRIWLVLMVALSIMLAACGSDSTTATTTATNTDSLAPLPLVVPEALALDGRPLRVVATTSIIGDIVGRVGGDAIEQKTLIGPGQDPHSYQPAAADLTAVANADVVFINGWDLEQGLVADLESIAKSAVIIPVNAGVVPMAFGQQHHEEEADHEEDEHQHEGADPHTWLDVSNVGYWTANIATILAALDPANAAVYESNAAAYEAELTALDTSLREQLAVIPEAKRVLVTNHDSFAYFAAAYGFEVLGTIIPGASTLSEPTASDLSGLVVAMQERDLCALFTETTVSDQLGRTVAAELKDCESVQVLPLFSGALGGTGSGAENYIGMMRANMAAIVSGLK